MDGTSTSLPTCDSGAHHIYFNGDIGDASRDFCGRVHAWETSPVCCRCTGPAVYAGQPTQEVDCGALPSEEYVLDAMRNLLHMATLPPHSPHMWQVRARRDS